MSRAKKKTFDDSLDTLFDNKADVTVKPRSGGKSFADDLGALFGGLNDEPKRKASGGIDSLIRSTATITEKPSEPKGKRRLTVTLPEGLIKKLKDKAREENTYLREIIQELVDEYLANNDATQAA